MISNPLWRKSLSEFEQQIREWFTQGDAQSMIWLATLCDAQPISGDRSLFESLREHFQVTYQNYATSNFINRFAKPILQFGDSSHFWQKFTGTSDNDIDLKKAGIFPIVHGVRTLSLEQGIEVTNTRRRLRELVNQHVLDDTTATNLADALDFFLAKRLEAALTTTDKSAWKVNPHDLSAMDKDLLKEALAIVKDFKALITLRYRLDIF
jgi:CBS domain-containing protein